MHTCIANNRQTYKQTNNQKTNKENKVANKKQTLQKTSK